MKNSARGFTLMEIMVAMMIASVVAVISIGALNFALRTKTIQSAKATRLSELQLAYVIMQNDIEQAINRPITNKLSAIEAAFLGGNPLANNLTNTASTYLGLTRGGIINPLWQQAESGMQRVQYVVENDNLVRFSWQALDQAPNSESSGRVILHGIKNFQVQFINNEGIVFNEWRTPVAFEEGSGSDEIIMENIPHGVRVLFEYNDMGVTDWLFKLAGNANETPE